MIYIFTESTMNGTFTSNIETTGIEAKTFEEAKYILQSRLDKIPDAEVYFNLDDRFDFIIKNQLFKVYGSMTNKPLRMMTI